MKKLFYLALSVLFFAGCETKEQTQPVDLGLSKTDVMEKKEEGGVTTLKVSQSRLDVSKLTAEGSGVTFEQKGNLVAMRRGNNVSGEFDCSCASVGENTGGSCRAVIIGNFLNCQNNGGCTGTCNLTIVINDLKAVKAFW